MFERSTLLLPTNGYNPPLFTGGIYLPETNLAIENRPSPKEIASFQPINFQGVNLLLVSGRGFQNLRRIWVQTRGFSTPRVPNGEGVPLSLWPCSSITST